jgi:catechol 2,3-dioxygenase-like lactoylglutathione lyase family enzyme
MAKLTSSAPVLFVRDVRASAEHYRDMMGFRFDRLYGEPPSFVILGRDGLHVMLKTASDHSAIIPRRNISPNLWDIYFWVDDVEELYREFRGRGAKIDYELCDQPYGCREFGTQDIDGHDIGFGQVVSRENSS